MTKIPCLFQRPEPHGPATRWADVARDVVLFTFLAFLIQQCSR